MQVRQVLDFYRPKAHEAGVEIIDYLSGNLPTVLLDREAFHGALLNLVLNAEQSMPHGGQLVLRTYGTADGVALDLIDTGCGMDEDTQSRVFETFFSTKRGGSGLGLPTTRKIIEAHGGRIYCKAKWSRHASHDQAAHSRPAAGRRRMKAAAVSGAGNCVAPLNASTLRLPAAALPSD